MKNLPYDASEDDIAKVFAKCGKAFVSFFKKRLFVDPIFFFSGIFKIRVLEKNSEPFFYQ